MKKRETGYFCDLEFNLLTPILDYSGSTLVVHGYSRAYAVPTLYLYFQVSQSLPELLVSLFPALPHHKARKVKQ